MSVRLGGLAAAAWALVACGGGGSGDERNRDAAPVADARPATDAAPPGDAAPSADSGAGPADAAAGLDATADAAPPIQPDELPTEGPGDLNGAADLLAAVPPGQARAGKVDADEERVTGPEANCRVGDFRLDNARVTACILAGHAFGAITDAGGNLVDAHRADRPGTDLLAEITLSPGLGEVTVDRIGVVRDGSEGGAAIVRVEGHTEGSRLIQNVLPGNFVPVPARVVTEYRLAPDSDTIDLLTWIDGERGGSLFMADMVYMGDRMRGLIGGAPPGVAGAGHYPFVAAEGDGVSYAWLDGDGTVDLFNIPLGDAPFVVGRQPAVHVRPGDRFLFRRHLRVGTGDIESVRTPPEGAVAQRFEGPAGARVQIVDAEGNAVTSVLLADGTGAAQLVPGAYTAEVVAWPGAAEPAVQFGAGEGVVRVSPTPPGRLRVRVRDPEDRPLSARVVVRNGGDDRTHFVRGEAELLLPPGDWTVTTTRGWHFTADERVATLAAGGESPHEVTLEEVIPTPGWASGEFHQHAGPSLDSTLPVEQRVLSNLAEGVAFMAPSDHDVIYDYASLAARMGLTDEIGVPLSGVEISPIFTHIGAYGIPYDAQKAAGGAPPLSSKIDGRWRALTVTELVTDARARGARVIQINHPRDGETKSFFGHNGYRPEIPVETLDPQKFTPDFDSIEVFNDNAAFCSVLLDWLGLLNQGLRVTGVGNSDTHGEGDAAGYPRNYLPTEAANPAHVTAAEVEQAMKAGAATVGAGAYLDLPDGPLPGAEVRPEAGVFRARVRVRTPPYARVVRLIAFHNGVPVVDRRLEAADEAIVDLDEVIDVPVDRDGPVVFFASGDAGLAYVRPGNPVFAFANPIWVDVDGGGVAPIGAGVLTLPPDLAVCR